MDKRPGIFKPKSKVSLVLKYAFFLFLLIYIGFNVVTVNRHHYVRGFSTNNILLTSEEQIVGNLLPYTSHRAANLQLDLNNCSKDYDTDVQECYLIKKFTEDYLDLHQALRYKLSRRFVFRPQLRGMGDMFGTLVFAYWAAVVSKRVFLVDWREPVPLEHLLQTALNTTDMFYRDAVDAQPHFLKDCHLLDGTNQSHVRFSNILSSNITTVIYTPQYRPPRHVLLAFAKQNGVDDEMLLDVLRLPSSSDFQRTLMHRVFQISDQIRRDHFDYAQHFKLSHGLEPIKDGVNIRSYTHNARPYIAVHARIGTGVGEVNGRFEDVQDNWTVPARCLGIRAVRLASISGSPPLPVFLATDTTEFRTVFLDIVRDISRGQVSVLSGDWDVVHSGRFSHPELTLNHSNVKNTASWKRVWGSYMDLVMLGHAEHIVSLYSEFPRFAFALGNSKTLTELRNQICTQTD